MFQRDINKEQLYISSLNEHHLPASTDGERRKAVSMVPRLRTVAVERWVGGGAVRL